MVKENIKDYKVALETRIRTFKELSKRGRLIEKSGTFLMLSSVVSLFVLVSIGTPILIAGYVMLLIMGIGTLMVFGGQRLNVSRGVPKFSSLYLSPDEKIFLRVFDALTFLEAYLKEKLEPARYQSLKKLRETYELMEAYWMPSEIKVVMKEIGGEIETFKEKFEKNLIYTLEYGVKTETFQAIYDILTEFEEFLVNPSKEKLVKLNESKKIDSLLHSEIERPRYPIIDFLKRHQAHQHVTVVASIFAVGFFSALLGVHYGHVSMDAAFVVFATIFGPLIAVYLTYVLRKK